MYKVTVKGNFTVAAIFAVIISILATSSAEARSEANRAFTTAGRQWLLIERMTNSALLAALGIDASPSLRSVHWSQDRFDRAQNGLREGDPHVGLSATTRPEILETLDRVDLQWQRYESNFVEIVTSADISEAQIRMLTESHANTIEAVSQMVDAFEHYVHGGNNHTILSSTIDGTEELRARTQLVLRGLLTVAYHGQTAQEREMLAQSTRDFDRTLNGLINGDLELQLLPAPTQEIKAELMKVDQMWDEVQPILVSAADGKAVTRDEIATVARYANDMAVPLTMTLLMYLSL